VALPVDAVGGGAVKWVFFVAVAGLCWGARTLGENTVADPAGSAMLALGALIIGGYLAGHAAVRWRLPRVTGYLVLGTGRRPLRPGSGDPRRRPVPATLRGAGAGPDRPHRRRRVPARGPRPSPETVAVHHRVPSSDSAGGGAW
jgi:hypothetical protein